MMELYGAQETTILAYKVCEADTLTRTDRANSGDSMDGEEPEEHLRKKKLPPFAHPPPVKNKTFAVKSEPVLV